MLEYLGISDKFAVELDKRIRHKAGYPGSGMEHRGQNECLLAPGYSLIAPYGEKTQEEPRDALDGYGELIWSGTPFYGH